MIFVGIDVAKDKHDCCILGPEGNLLLPTFSFPNNRSGFSLLLDTMDSLSVNAPEIKVGLEATGHYHLNLLRSLLDHGIDCFVLNPLHTSRYRKGKTLRETKTDKIDARNIAKMLISEKELKPYSEASYHNEELKSLTRYRFDKVQERAKLRMSVSRLVNILFPELEDLVSHLHSASVYALLSEFPGASLIAGAHLTRLTNLLSQASRGAFGRDKALAIRAAARSSVGTPLLSKSMELKQTIQLINFLDAQIDELDTEIDAIMASIPSTVTTIPGIKNRMGAMILAEIGDFSFFDNPDKILAFAGLSPSTHQSGTLYSSHAHLEKRGSKYLRYALFNATRYVCMYDSVFAAYLAKKRAEGKHYYVAITHACKKLVRLIYQLQLTGEVYKRA